jgi:hypothetical protein
MIEIRSGGRVAVRWGGSDRARARPIGWEGKRARAGGKRARETKKELWSKHALSFA